VQCNIVLHSTIFNFDGILSRSDRTGSILDTGQSEDKSLPSQGLAEQRLWEGGWLPAAEGEGGRSALVGFPHTVFQRGESKGIGGGGVGPWS
jgi:hypothetical protein